MELKLKADLKFGGSGNSFPCGTLIIINNKAVKLIEHSNTDFLKSEFSKGLFPIKPNTYEIEYLHKYNSISEVHNATIQIKDGFKFYVNINRKANFKIKWMSLVYWTRQTENTLKVLAYITGTIIAVIGLLYTMSK
jgi:hypothetical protein